MRNDSDPRFDALRRWIGARLGGARFTLAPASEDASFRRYFRAALEDGRSFVAMDAPPGKEDCAPFLRVGALLREAGVHAPEVHAQDLAQGFLLLADLGTTSYLDALNDGSAAALFRDATEALIRWQLASRPNVLPDYDRALLRREMELFPEWYLGRHLNFSLSSSFNQDLERIFQLLEAKALSQPRVFVHRDYMPRNLMVSEPNPGILDFQDAVHGPITYDVISLFKDAFISWEEEQILDWVIRYWEKAKKAGLPVRSDFGEYFRDLEWMGLQRHLKVLGIFTRIHYRDGKPHYLADTPRFMNYVRETAVRYSTLKPLLRLLDELENRSAQIGHAS